MGNYVVKHSYTYDVITKFDVHDESDYECHITYNDYEHDKCILTSKHKSIWLAHDANDPTKKVIIKKTVYPTERGLQEARCLAIIKHDNIVRFLLSYSMPSYTYVVVQYIEGHDLLTKVNNKQITISGLIQVFKDIVDALVYMKVNHAMTHGDISPENIMIQKGRGILIDFEDARIIVDNHDINIRVPFGKADYMDPNVLYVVNPINAYAADVWSLGMNILSCLTHISDKDRTYILLNGARPVLSGRGVDNELFNLACDMVQIEVTSRPTIEEVQRRIKSI